MRRSPEAPGNRAARPFHPKDAPAVAALVHAAVHAIGTGHCDRARLAADGRDALVAIDAADAVIAWGDLKADGHLDHALYRSDVSGCDVAATLYAALEAIARRKGMARIHVEASEPARRFFARHGFAPDHRRDFIPGNVPIHSYRMTRSL